MSQPNTGRPSLADAFKGTGGDRAAGLAGLLPPTRRTPALAPTPAEPPTTSAPEPTPAPPRERAAQKAPKQPARPEQAGVQNVPAYLEPDLLAAVRLARRDGLRDGDPDRTYDELLIDALEHVALDEMRDDFAAVAPAGRGPLQPRARRRRGAGGIQIQLRLNGAQRAALDDLVRSAGAPSRSAFVAAAYRRRFLPD